MIQIYSDTINFRRYGINSIIEHMTPSSTLHQESIVIDGTCPLIDDPRGIPAYRAGGFTAVAPTVGDNENGAAGTLRKLGSIHKVIREDAGLVLVRKARDIEAAKASGKMGLILHFQGAEPIENRLEYIDAYKSMGVGMIQLTYNVKNRLGDGCEERTDAGLSKFGLAVIKRMNEARVIVDCSHTGLRTTLDAIEASTRPPVFSHAGVRAVHPSPRNIVDEQIKAVAAKGGLVGANAYPPFVSADKPPTLEQLIDHIRYIVDLVGIDHVGLGLDYFAGQSPYSSDEHAMAAYKGYLESGMWSSKSYPPPPYIYPKGIETPDKAPHLTDALLRSGFNAEEVKKIIGGNWMRVFREVWGE
ncbi:dipeptidase [Caenimonas soli]|uniref:dipeptidase n=1 Tax=Caenimonas soli TaxID=2735555 RepID=UPI001F2FDAA6|nr:dipeptidase [Caenimonas soli]